MPWGVLLETRRRPKPREELMQCSEARIRHACPVRTKTLARGRQGLHVYTARYNRHRPHRSVSLQPPDEAISAPGCAAIRHFEGHKLLGRLTDESEAAA